MRPRHVCMLCSMATSRSHRPLYLTIALNCLTTRNDHPFHQQTRHPPRGGHPRLGNCGRKVERKGRWVAVRGGTAGLTGLTLPTRPDLRPQASVPTREYSLAAACVPGWSAPPTALVATSITPSATSTMRHQPPTPCSYH